MGTGTRWLGRRIAGSTRGLEEKWQIGTQARAIWKGEECVLGFLDGLRITLDATRPRAATPACVHSPSAAALWRPGTPVPQHRRPIISGDQDCAWCVSDATAARCTQQQLHHAPAERGWAAQDSDQQLYTLPSAPQTLNCWQACEPGGALFNPQA